jgi:hypothetical protein
MESHIIVRVDESLRELVFEVAKARGERPSDFARRAIKTELARLNYLSSRERKALGLKTGIAADNGDYGSNEGSGP